MSDNEVLLDESVATRAAREGAPETAFPMTLPDGQPRRWFVKKDATGELAQNGGFATRAQAMTWLDGRSRELEWRAGFVFKLWSVQGSFSIVDRHGKVCRS